VIKALLQPTPESLAEAIKRIVHTVHPTRILAFGSRARGEHERESDVDLLVVLPAGAEHRDVAADLYEAVGALGFSKDLLLSNEERLERLSTSINSVEAQAAREGITLYENGRTDRTAVAQICR